MVGHSSIEGYVRKLIGSVMQHIHLTLMGLLNPGGVVHLSWVGMIIVSTLSDCFHAGKLY